MRLGPRRALILLAGALALGVAGPGWGEGQAEFVSRLDWTGSGADFGGWSGLDLSADGTRFAAITDRGGLVTGTLRRDADGRLVGIDPGPMQTLSLPDALARYRPDTEGLALAPDGRLFVSVEPARRVLAYPADDLTAPQALPVYPPFRQLHGNRSLEALALGPDGALYTLPEGWPEEAPFPVARFRDGVWEAFGSVARSEGFAPVGADIGPDGRFYLLERKLLMILGFAARVRRFEIGPEGLTGGEVLLRSRTGAHDNLEGLAVWRDAAGALRLTMVSDDNFAPWQKTELVEYRLAE